MEGAHCGVRGASPPRSPRPAKCGGLLAQKVEDDLAPVRAAAVLEDVDPLPRSKQQLPLIDRYRKPGLRKRGPQMGRHIIQALALVDIALAILWRDRLEKPLNVSPHLGIGILLDEQGRRSMAAEER